MGTKAQRLAEQQSVRMVASGSMEEAQTLLGTPDDPDAWQDYFDWSVSPPRWK